MLKDDISDVFIFQQRLLFAHRSNHKYNCGTQNCVLIHISLVVTTSSQIVA